MLQKSVPIEGSRDTNAAIQFAAGSRCCSNSTGRSLSSRLRMTRSSAAWSMQKILQYGSGRCGRWWKTEGRGVPPASPFRG